MRTNAMRYLLLSTLLLLATGCGETVTDTGVADDAITQTVAISVPSIVCENCAAGVCKTLERTPGVAAVEVDVETKVATVEFNERVFDAKEALANLTDAGYEESQMLDAATTKSSTL